MTGYFGNDLRPVSERIAVLPLIFLVDPAFIVGQTYQGEPKPEGVDNHAHTPEWTDRPTIYLDCVFLANSASEALKLSHHWKVAFIDCHFSGGVEEPVDICRGGDLYFYHCDFESALVEGRDLTLKGGARRVTFECCQNLRQLTLGEYSKYDAKAAYPDGSLVIAGLRTLARPAVRETRLIDCGPLTVTRIHSDIPEAIGDTQMTLKNCVPHWVVPAYFWARARFFKETNPAPEAEFKIDPREV